VNVKSLHDYVIVRRKEEEHLTVGGIVIPDPRPKSRSRERCSRWATDGSSREEKSCHRR